MDKYSRNLPGTIKLFKICYTFNLNFEKCVTLVSYDIIILVSDILHWTMLMLLKGFVSVISCSILPS